ncbi:MAG: MATE family efflux transporter [Gammaproteobacteria bacterium]|nr:MATE family efflux transporter [Gammaproteobacteria bacterium]
MSVNSSSTVSYQSLWQLAWPMMLAGVSTPLLGLVDSAVMGHLPTAHYLGAVSLGGLIFSFLYWGFGFLRMGTTGLVAQLLGANNHAELRATIKRVVSLALLIGCFIVLAQIPISAIAFWFIETDTKMLSLTQTYFDIRVWSAPAALCSYVLVGIFIGMQNTRASLVLLVVTNCINIVLDILFVPVLGWQVEGVAIATLIAEYCGVLVGLVLLWRLLKPLRKDVVPSHWFNLKSYRSLLGLNYYIFLRTLMLISVFAFFTLQGASMGENVLAANALLMNFITFMAFALDGFAHSAEAMVGRFLGAKHPQNLLRAVKLSGHLSFATAIGFCIFYGLFIPVFMTWLTDIPQVIETAKAVQYWMVILPLIAVWSYWFDGLFIGVTWSKPMRDTMFVSALVFFSVWYVTQSWSNQGLWFALASFFLARGLSMFWWWQRHYINLLRG